MVYTGKDDFEQKCYDAYQLHWMLENGLSLSDYADVLKMGMQEAVDLGDIKPNEEVVDELFEAGNEAFFDQGFRGSCFVCKSEFLGAEFMDGKYMKELLKLTSNTDKDYKKAFEFYKENYNKEA